MDHSGELRLLLSTFDKIRLPYEQLSVDELKNRVERGFDSDGTNVPIADTSGGNDPFPLDKALYKAKDSYGFNYLFFKLSESGEAMLIGPYLTEPVTSEQILEIVEAYSLEPKRQRHLAEYLSGTTVIPDGSSVFVILYSFCENIWSTASFPIIALDELNVAPVSPINETLSTQTPDEALVSMAAMEKRYMLENELISAVTNGQMHKEDMLTGAFNERAFERRVPDALRNAKNYGIIMNTLLRKAAEHGGVHPIYIDRISSEFARKIENMPALAENGALMAEMFRTYCRLVRKHSMKNYSPPVQKTILIIDSDLSAPLSPSEIARSQGISHGYLSTLFKKEVGMTVVEYIWQRRISHAAHLLKTTNLQVQTIALHCGVDDIQYFSKTFKKHTGKTPKEYRELSKN